VTKLYLVRTADTNDKVIEIQKKTFSGASLTKPWKDIKRVIKAKAQQGIKKSSTHRTGRHVRLSVEASS
jgi:hypothetical protein